MPRFVVHARALGLKPGVDADRLNQLVDELESEAAARKFPGTGTWTSWVAVDHLVGDGHSTTEVVC